ncbi:MAG: hypothetical protein JSV64_00345 [Candidatus Bathyarchaeota archaeon]|nr:MAG: hypothetical protein JSV64_00345 [Candidatus Bathyarchaeota archaeon]
MVAPLMSHLICTTALIALIVLMPFYFFYITNSVTNDITRRELKEVSDYVSNSLANLYFLANSTDLDVVLRKDLDLPREIHGKSYYTEIAYDENNASALYVTSRLMDNDQIYGNSWILRGLDANLDNCVIDSSREAVFAECVSNASGFWIALKEG